MSFNENFSERKLIPTEPFDSNDPPRFGQLVETAKDSFAREFKNYFSYKTSDISSKLNEIPNIEKYHFDPSNNSMGDYGTTVDLILSFADTPDKFPMVAITSAQVQENKLSIGGNLATPVQYPPSVVGNVSGPYSLQDGWTIEFKTWPGGTVASETTSTITFHEFRYQDINNVTLTEIINDIRNTQALYYTLEETPDGFLRISTGGPAARSTPNYIEITGGDPDCLAAFGFSVGDSDTYLSQDNLPRNRYYIASDMTINIDVIGDSANTKQELSDLIFQFFAYYMEKRQFQFLGRSYFQRGLDPEEWFHIIFKNNFSWSSEVVKPRPGSGEGYDYIYAVRGSMPITIVDFIDKEIPYSTPQYLDDSSIEYGETVSTGDYFSTNYRK
jgi:hypothetical protein